jgi:hypothetical protein
MGHFRSITIFASTVFLGLFPLPAEESGGDRPVDLLAPRLPAKKVAPAPPSDPSASPAPTPARLTKPHTGPVQPYDRLARDNIHVTAHALENGSAGMTRWIYYWNYYYNSRSRTITQNKLIEINLSGIGNKGGDVTVQCYAVIRRDGASEVVTRCADQDIITDGAGKWCVAIQAIRQERQSYYYSYYGRRTYVSGEKIAGFFVRVIRDGRIVGYTASPSAYERFALDTDL